MDSDDEARSDRVPLPGFDGAGSPGQAGTPAAARRDGIRHVRRVSNWTAAALIVGTGAATMVLAHQAFPAAAPATSTASATAGTASGTAASGTAASGVTPPSASHSVVTTSGSGVTTTTTTHIVNGKTVISRGRNVPAYQDN